VADQQKRIITKIESNRPSNRMTVDIGGVHYKINEDGTGAIAQKKADGGSPPPDLAILPAVDIAGKRLPVVAVARMAFSNSGLTSVRVPSSVTEIEGAAFEKNKGLRAIVFEEPSSVQHIGPAAFQETEALTSVSIPASVKHIDCWAFKLCPKLTQVTVPVDGNLEKIDDAAFEGCDINEFLLPSKVQQIIDRAFRQNRNLKKFTLGPNPQLVGIGPGTFSETDLEELVIPPNLNTIGSWTFLNTPRFRNINITHQHPINYFGAWIFEGTKVTEIEVPDALEVLDTGAYQGVVTLTKASFSPNSKLTRLGARAFAETNITGVNLPASLKQADIEVFKDCKELRIVAIPGTSQFEYIPPRAFDGCVKLVKVDLPGAIHLSENVFNACSALKSVKFITVVYPENVSAEERAEINKRRKRVLQLPRLGAANIFGDAQPYVLYPEGPLKAARKQLVKELEFI
jgi:hypothetical protein